MWKATSRQGRSIIEACAARSFMLRTAESVKTHGVIRTSALSAKLLFGRRMRPGESRAGMTRHRGNGAAPTNGMCPTRTVRNKRNRNNSGLNASKKRLMWPRRRRKAMDMALVPGRAGTWVPKGFWRLLQGLEGFTAGKRQA